MSTTVGNPLPKVIEISTYETERVNSRRTHEVKKFDDEYEKLVQAPTNRNFLGKENIFTRTIALVPFIGSFFSWTLVPTKQRRNSEPPDHTRWKPGCLSPKILFDGVFFSWLDYLVIQPTDYESLDMKQDFQNEYQNTGLLSALLLQNATNFLLVDADSFDADPNLISSTSFFVTDVLVLMLRQLL